MFGRPPAPRERARRNGEVVAHELELRVLCARKEHFVGTRDRDSPPVDHELLFVSALTFASRPSHSQ